MADVEELKEQKTKKQNQGLFGQMGGTQKALLIIFGLAMFFLVWTFLFGGITTIYQLIAFLFSFAAIGALFYGILFFIQWYLAPEYFSPRKDYFNRLVNLAQDLKPSNVQDLYCRGSLDKKRVKLGKIIGLLGIPYFIGQQKKDSQGTPIFEKSKLFKAKMPLFEKIHYGEDGDTFFIYESGWLFFKRKHYLRCHKSLHGDLNGDVEIYDINPIPYGSLFEYPFRQLQASAGQIMIQNQLEVILATHEHQYDLISQGVDSAVYFNPYFRLMHKQASEMSNE